ncbi:MAG: hypothetical protein ABSF17_14235 [Terracidiphilus sp.]
MDRRDAIAQPNQSACQRELQVAAEKILFKKPDKQKAQQSQGTVANHCPSMIELRVEAYQVQRSQNPNQQRQRSETPACANKKARKRSFPAQPINAHAPPLDQRHQQAHHKDRRKGNAFRNNPVLHRDRRTGVGFALRYRRGRLARSRCRGDGFLVSLRLVVVMHHSNCGQD